MRESWLVAGDMNDIAFDREKKGGATICQNKCKKFIDWIDKCGLIDLGAVGARFTWKGPIYNDGQLIYERLDRALFNENCRIYFRDGFV
ncbi:unnamed protein product [Lathyrus sativus]|nr:unnamed protein product [Lathyrus sativus]